MARALGVETELVEGRRGEFTVWVGDQLVATKDRNGFPSEDEIRVAVGRALAGR